MNISSDLHWIDGPEYEGETSNGTEENLGLVILPSNGSSAVQGELIDDNKVGNASKGVPAPFLAIIATKSGEETSNNHDQICNHGDENVGTTKTGQEAQVEKQEWGGEAPVNVACPVDFTVDILNRVILVHSNFVLRDAITSGHSEVGEEGESGDEGSQDMEESFLLRKRELASVLLKALVGKYLRQGL